MEETQPQKTLSVLDVAALIIGVVVGTGIFKTPSLVAANTGSARLFFLAWLLGGFVSLLGALCYAELACTHPHSGGDYHFLRLAFGPRTAFLFGWARLTVIQPGSIAMLAFVCGDYVAQLVPGTPSALVSPLAAFTAVFSLTAANVLGTRQGAGLQRLLTAAKVAGLIAVVAAGLLLAPPLAAPAPRTAPGSFGLAMVFVLLTFGGWNEAAYLSAEVRRERDMALALLLSLGVITAIYLAAGLAYFKTLGMGAMAGAEAVAAEAMKRAIGQGGADFVSLLIALSALGAINGTVMSGSRSAFALGRDFVLLGALGRWREKSNTPANALFFQGVLTSGLLWLGAFTRQGFTTMVEFTAPVFWFFFFLAGLSLIILRRRQQGMSRPFSVPLYPLVPIAFCASCLFMLASSLLYTGIGALVGVGVLGLGALLSPFACRRRNE